MDLSTFDFDAVPPLTFDVIAAAIACGRRLQAEIDEALYDDGLTWTGFHALVELASSGGPTHGGALARRMGVSRQTAHTHLRRLESRGLLRTRTEPWVRLIWLSPDGQDVLDQVWRSVGDIWRALERLGVPERRAVVAAEAAIRRELRRARRPPPRDDDWLWRPQLWDAMG